MTGLLLEAIVEYHRVTGNDSAADSIFRALDWLINECLVPSSDTFIYTTADVNRDSDGEPDLNLLIVHAFGYGYRISGYQREEYLDIGRKVFERGINEAYLSRRKHFNQNYRSSGHFLAYIKDRATKEEGLNQTADSSVRLQDKDILLFEGFEESVGKFKSFLHDALLNVDTSHVYLHGNSLYIRNKFAATPLCVGVALENWNIADYPFLNFAYSIPHGTSVGLQVKTEYGDLFCIGGTDSYKSETAVAKQSVFLTDDGQWHEIAIDIKNTVGSVLPGVKHIFEFQFCTNKDTEEADEFWIDDFEIGR